MVLNLRRELAPLRPSAHKEQIPRKVERNGKVYTQNTARIGKTDLRQAIKETPRSAAAAGAADRREKAEIERRKLFSVRVIQVLEEFSRTDIPSPERTVEEFFEPIAHDVDPALDTAVRWFTEFARLWRKYERRKRAA